MNRFKTAFLSEFVKHSKSTKMVSANAFKRVCKTFSQDYIDMIWFKHQK